ncbi:Uncharacterized protein PECH_006502 [Penicillium ucsense]|uniref:Phosphoglycerate mutase-like protein n=1 Tax=Penicillium ucsense TaxID=2839758 RepID=A0A8J8W0N8_9EURO|nr:Uncharacterized protein PECM_006734 [Penicillium ucsense]KAF7735599.1 Uncharacterized protein PECH_006502 [Penicillium ucsense]
MRTSALIPIVLSALCPVMAQEYQETVWGIFAFTTHGDSTPNLLAEGRFRVLSDYGANQLADAGAAFRDRYLSSGGVNNSQSTIQYLSDTVLDPQDVEVYALTDQYVVASAQAFMQGLYPPLGQTGLESSDVTVNGAAMISPLNGYQYPQLISLGQSDPQSVALNGNKNCPTHQALVSKYKSGDYALGISEITNGFYVDIWHDILSGVMNETSANYLNAVEIFEYIEHELAYNSTAQTQITEDKVRQARWWADHYTYATNHQLDSGEPAGGSINSVAGQTLAARIMSAFNANIGGYGTGQKMNLVFGDDDAAVALASLLSLASEQHPNMYCRPNRGASLVFELFSFESSEAYPTYPVIDNLYVRFLIHNDTGGSAFSPYPMFGHGPSHEYVPYSEFQSELETFALSSTHEWCKRCNSEAVFCTGLDSNKPGPSTGNQEQMAPAVAGIIGAVIMLAALGLLAAIGLTFWTLRNRGSNQKPPLGGFKGTRKLASDTDVTFHSPDWKASNGADAQMRNDTADTVVLRGHERVGSWEMGQPKKGDEDRQNASHSNQLASDDEHEEEWRIVSGLRAVEARESV